MRIEKRTRSCCIAAMALGPWLGLAASSAWATNYHWDANGAAANLGGTGAWNTTSSLWRTPTNTDPLTTWPGSGTDNDAIFGGTAGTVTIAAGGVTANELTFNTTNYTITGASLTLNGTTPTITVTPGSANIILDVNLVGTSGFTKAGISTSVLRLNANNSGLSGTVSISSGIVRFTNANAGSTAAAWDVASGAQLAINDSVVTVNGGTVNLGSLSGSGVLRVGGSTANNNTYSIGALGTDTTFSGVMNQFDSTTVSNITKVGGGKLTLSGNSSSGASARTGITTINAGTLSISADNNLGTNTSATAITFGGGSLEMTATMSTAKPVTLNAAGGSVNVTGSNTATMSGAFIGSGALTKSGTGTLTLTAPNTYNGTTTISGGTLQLGDGTSGNDGTIANSLSIVNNANLTYNRFGSTSYSGAISGTGSVTKLGAGTQALTGSNSYSGTTTIAAGTLSANSSVALGDGSVTNMLVFTGGTLQAGGAIASPGTRSVTLTSTGSIHTNGNDVSIAGVMSGGGGLTKSGAGTLALTGANLYSGNTTVSAGTLLVNNSTGSGTGTGTVTVGSTATLGGSGFIGGNTTIQGGGTVSPGNSPGTLTYTNASLTWNDNGNYNWQVFNATHASPTAGTDYDTVSITGSGILDLSALTGGTDFNINLWSLSGLPNSSGNATNWDATQPHAWTLVSTPTAISGFNPANFTINTGANNGTNGFTNGLSGGTFSLGLTDSGTDLSLIFTPLATNPVLGAAVTSGSATFGGVLRNGTVPAAEITLTNTGGATTDITANTVAGFTITAPTPQVVATSGTATSTVTLNTATNGTFGGNVDYTANPGGVTTAPIAVSAIVGNASYATGTGVNSSTAYGPALISQYGAISSLPNLESSTVGGVGDATPVAALVGSTATILNYDNTGGSTETISMQWRTRTTAEATQSNPNALLSDVVNLTGMISGAETMTPSLTATGTGVFVLQMSYLQTTLDAFGLSENSIATSGELRLGWNNAGTWETAGLGNVGAGGGTATFIGAVAYDPNNPTHNVLGAYGVDISSTIGGVVWAVLNHNSEFAVIPEPSTFVLGGLALFGFAGAGLRRRRRQQRHTLDQVV